MADTVSGENRSGSRTVLMVLAWLWVLVPFVYGVWQLLVKIVPLFGG
ncbi:MAG TPA: hypothetical protein VGM60_03100 [Pseudonocardia sp.]|jgi:hypothetical protein